MDDLKFDIDGDGRDDIIISKTNGNDVFIKVRLCVIIGALGAFASTLAIKLGLI